MSVVNVMIHLHTNHANSENLYFTVGMVTISAGLLFDTL